jgi:hypothetical protein
MEQQFYIPTLFVFTFFVVGLRGVTVIRLGTELLQGLKRRSPEGPKNGWGNPGGLLGIPWGLLGGPPGDDPGGAPPADDPWVKPAKFWTFGG